MKVWDLDHLQLLICNRSSTLVVLMIPRDVDHVGIFHTKAFEGVFKIGDVANISSQDKNVYTRGIQFLYELLLPGFRKLKMQITHQLNIHRDSFCCLS